MDLKITSPKVREIFAYRQPRNDGTGQFDGIRLRFAQLAQSMENLLPDGREKALMFTHLQLSLMFANAAHAASVGEQRPFANDDGEAGPLVVDERAAAAGSGGDVASALDVLAGTIEDLRNDMRRIFEKPRTVGYPPPVAPPFPEGTASAADSPPV